MLWKYCTFLNIMFTNILVSLNQLSTVICVPYSITTINQPSRADISLAFCSISDLAVSS